jgi:DHA1 family tetracycline resistance protein-like MFS transporter
MKTDHKAFAFILITLVIDAMGIGLILPVMPDLISRIAGGTLGNAAIWGGVLASAFAIMQFLFSPLLGAISDRLGRRPVLLTSLFVMCLDYIVMALAGTIWLLLAARILAGITAATQSTATAYIADISTPAQKTARFGLVGAAFGVGFVLGPVIGGLLANWGTSAPFLAAAALAGANFLFGLAVLPETVTDRIRRPFEWRRANPLGAFRKLAELPEITRLMLLFFLYEFAFIVYPAIWAYFTKARFGWSPSMVGLSLATFGIAVAVVQGGLVGAVVKRFGERGTITYGILFNLCAFLFLALVWNGWVALAFTPITALGAVVTPALHGRMSRLAADNQQGELQGVVASVRAVAAIASPLVMTQIFWLATPQTGASLPGAPFLLSALLMLICFAVFQRSASVHTTALP